MFKAMTTRESVLRLRQKDPEITATEMAGILGVSRERVRQVLNLLGLSTQTRRSRLPTTRRRNKSWKPIRRIVSQDGKASIEFDETCHIRLRGSWAELTAAADLARRGYEVFLPSYNSCSCDMLTLKDGKAERIEVKLGHWNGARYTGHATRRQKPKFDRLAIVGKDGEVAYKPDIPQRRTT